MKLQWLVATWSHSGQSLDQLKMHVCIRVNISDLSYLNFTQSTSNTTKRYAIHQSLIQGRICPTWALDTLNGFGSESVARGSRTGRFFW